MQVCDTEFVYYFVKSYGYWMMQLIEIKRLLSRNHCWKNCFLVLACSLFSTVAYAQQWQVGMSSSGTLISASGYQVDSQARAFEKEGGFSERLYKVRSEIRAGNRD